MKKSIKTISILLIAFVLLAPQVVSAVWWNPFTWFKKKQVKAPVELVVNETPKTKETKPIVKKEVKQENTINNKSTTKEVVKSIEKEAPKNTTAITQTPNILETKPIEKINIPEYAPLKPFVAPLGYIRPPETPIVQETQPIVSYTPPTIVTKESGKLSFISGGPNGGNINLNKDGLKGQTLWEAVGTVSAKNLEITSLKLRNVGSASANTFGVFKLYINGTQVATTTSIDGNGYINFDFSTVKLDIGNINFKMTADINGGNGRTIQFSLRHNSDINVVEADTKERVSPSGIPIGGANLVLNIEPGRLAITKSSDSPSGTISDGESNVVLARYKVEAFNEEMGFGDFPLAFKTNNPNLSSLRNVTLYADGVKISHRPSLKKEPDQNTLISLITSVKIEPGQSVILEIRGDVYDNDEANDVSSGDTIQIVILPGSSNVKLVDSLRVISVPSEILLGNVLSISEN